ncbi:hypothetical protein [Halomonas sp. H5]|uniref:hypothetical protein n=1 Tax=Halomonas sp. H5 TaxID=3423910 RepID=UPI003D369B96
MVKSNSLLPMAGGLSFLLGLTLAFLIPNNTVAAITAITVVMIVNVCTSLTKKSNQLIIHKEVLSAALLSGALVGVLTF